MGNNEAYRTFQRTILVLYDRRILDVATLDELAGEYMGTDIDSGGDMGMTTSDGKTLEEICIELVAPAWIPVRGKDEDYLNPDEWELEEQDFLWESIRRERWGWR